MSTSNIVFIANLKEGNVVSHYSVYLSKQDLTDGFQYKESNLMGLVFPDHQNWAHQPNERFNFISNGRSVKKTSTLYEMQHFLIEHLKATKLVEKTVTLNRSAYNEYYRK